MKSQFAQNLERKCSGHVISVTYLLFIKYFLHLITSLCPCGFMLVQMCWAGFPQVPDLAQPLHRTLSQVQLKTGFTATSFLSLTRCHLAAAFALTQTQMDLWSYYGLLVLYCLRLHEMDTQYPKYFQKPVLVSPFFF